MLAIVAGYEVLYSQPSASSFLASLTSATVEISMIRLRLAGVLVIALCVACLCTCSFPYSSTSFHLALPVTVSSPTFSKAIGWFGKPAALQRLHSCIFLCGL